MERIRRGEAALEANGTRIGGFAETERMLPLPPESPEPAARSSQCSAITDDNEVFVYGGVPLDSANRGPLGPVLSDLWVFNSTCPATLPVLQPLNVEKWSPSPPAEVTSEPAGQLRVFSMNSQ